jgi:ribosomal protein S18 acetylase RimI-like enzyme
MGHIHVRAWQRAYAGQMPAAYLDALRAEDRAAMWHEALMPGESRSEILVAERHGKLVGFTVVGPVQENPEVGELYAINVDPDVWNQGAGSALLDAAHHALAAAGYPRAVLWVLPGNDRARRFYERRMWRCDEEYRDLDVLGVRVSEVRYSHPASTGSRLGTERRRTVYPGR